jgi:hypothetical protein
MAALKGKAKAAFLARMAKGRKKASRGNPKNKLPGPWRIQSGAGVIPYEYGGKIRYRAQVDGKPVGSLSFTSFSAAKTAAKKAAAKKIHGNPEKKRGDSKKRRRNQETSIEEASQMFEQFHGKRPGRIVEYDQPYNYPDNFAELGKLKELRFDLDQRNKNFPLTNFGACQAVSTPDGSNIYFIGGDQRIDFEALNIASDKDFVELGPATYIMYHTVKGFHDFDPTDYYHSFGEDDGILPVLVYDRLNHTLFLIGGNYRVRPEGIVN